MLLLILIVFKEILSFLDENYQILLIFSFFPIYLHINFSTYCDIKIELPREKKRLNNEESYRLFPLIFFLRKCLQDKGSTVH